MVPQYLQFFLATIETRRGVFDLATSINDLQIAVVENTLAPQVTEESVVRLYDVGRYIYLISGGCYSVKCESKMYFIVV